MDKYEYRVRAEEIEALIKEGEFAEAVKIADTIDWRRVKSVAMLCKISDLYKINRRYQESMDILLLAYDKHPTGRSIVYSLCELSIKMEDFVQAIERYKEFVQIAPKDTGQYILLYRLYEAQEVTLEERITVLEEFKKRDYREKWAYELAYLYHRIGLTTKCIDECDEMYLWFGEGKYVMKALELKMLHVPLNSEQQIKYDEWTAKREAGIEEEEEEVVEEALVKESEEDQEEQSGENSEETENFKSSEQDILSLPTTELPEVKTVDVGQYNTINLQMALAESMKEILTEEESESEPEEQMEPEVQLELDEQPEADEELGPENESEPDELQESQEEAPSFAEKIIAPLLEETMEMPFDGVEQDADELQETGSLPEAETEVLYSRYEEEPESEPEEEIAYSWFDAGPETTIQESEPISEPVFEAAMWRPRFEPGATNKYAEPEATLQYAGPGAAPVTEMPYVEPESEPEAEMLYAEPESEPEAAMPYEEPESEPVAAIPYVDPQPETEQQFEARPYRYEDVLSQEYDGQIRLVVPDVKKVEKQITGQLSIEDIMAEWEQMKKSNEQKRMEDVRKRILNQTDGLFADFDEATKSGLLEQLEKAFVAAMTQDVDDQPAIKKVVAPDGTEIELNGALQSEIPANIKEMIEAEDTDALSERQENAEVTGDATEELIETEETVTADPAESEGSRMQSPQELKAERELTDEEQEIFGQYAQNKKVREQLIHTLDNMSMAACTGNVLISGEEDNRTLALAKDLIREMQYNDSNFSGKVAKVSAAVLNKKDVASTLKKLTNGALIIEKGADLNEETVVKLNKFLETDNIGLLLILEDTKKRVNKLLAEHSGLNNSFNLRVDIAALDDEALVACAKQYAEEKEYSIDEFGVLALHTRIADKQTSDHEVSVSEVKELVDEAIFYANKKTPKHFVDILLAKRYDENDMIILRENDFMHN